MTGPRLRVMSYNVRSLRDDAPAVGRVMRAAEPDVVLVQEAPRFLRWRSHAASIARRGGLVAVTGGRTAAGNLVLASLRIDVLDTAEVLLSPVPGLHRRGVAMALLRLAGTRFAVAGTHLDLEPGPRRRHLDEIVAALATFAPGVPTIVGGDMNDVPGSALWDACTVQRSDVFAAVGEGPGETIGVTNPNRRIDALFVDPTIVPVAARVVDSPDVRIASDHRPLVADVDLP